jgi:FkbM family methyltransferase
MSEALPHRWSGTSKLRRLGRWIDAALERLAARQAAGAGLGSLCGHHFVAQALDADSVVVDLGANRGELSRQIRRRFGSRCFAVEPVPELLAAIGDDEVASKVQAAVVGSGGKATLTTSRNPEAASLYPTIAKHEGATGTIVVPAVTLEALLERWQLTHVDLLKVDVEGAEVELLEALDDSGFERFGQITVEFHDFLPGATPPAVVRRVVQRLRRLGFFALVMSRPRHDHSDVLFLRPGQEGTPSRLRLLALARTLDLRALLRALANRR